MASLRCRFSTICPWSVTSLQLFSPFAHLSKHYDCLSVCRLSSYPRSLVIYIYIYSFEGESTIYHVKIPIVIELLFRSLTPLPSPHTPFSPHSSFVSIGIFSRKTRVFWRPIAGIDCLVLLLYDLPMPFQRIILLFHLSELFNYHCSICLCALFMDTKKKKKLIKVLITN